MARILVDEPSPWFLPELQRQYGGENVSMIAGNERQRRVAARAERAGALPETTVCVIADLRRRPERCVEVVEDLRHRHPEARLILIGDERLAPLEWVLRELGVAIVETNPVRGVDLKRWIDPILQCQSSPRDLFMPIQKCR
ncbi:hypothetical protein [Planctopirus hydrillae]|uniref:Response regulatory domain-containing protein n=1 Tax=Planctopirus hydrillae TaxID=1841610 RepID=A0A1C3EMI8_9PLAN|nr:hypothetical protein [Planctopirus hydrillae]ODA34442.1 hypothetical protein A6X21_17445 [Planctopirus hydrillae]